MRGTHVAVPDPRNADVLVYVNGDFVPRDRASVSVFDSAFLVGDGVWEGLRLHDGRFVFLDRHLDRLFASAAAVGLDIGAREDIVEILDETVRRNAMTTDVHVRLMISRGTKSTPSQDPRLVIGDPTIVVIAEHKRADPGISDEGITLFTSSVRRPPPDTLDQRSVTRPLSLQKPTSLHPYTASIPRESLLLTAPTPSTTSATN